MIRLVTCHHYITSFEEYLPLFQIFHRFRKHFFQYQNHPNRKIRTNPRGKLSPGGNVAAPTWQAGGNVPLRNLGGVRWEFQTATPMGSFDYAEGDVCLNCRSPVIVCRWEFQKLSLFQPPPYTVCVGGCIAFYGCFSRKLS